MVATSHYEPTSCTNFFKQQNILAAEFEVISLDPILDFCAVNSADPYIDNEHLALEGFEEKKLVVALAL